VWDFGPEWDYLRVTVSKRFLLVDESLPPACFIVFSMSYFHEALLQGVVVSTVDEFYPKESMVVDPFVDGITSFWSEATASALDRIPEIGAR
jgi:hypothetical protein